MRNKEDAIYREAVSLTSALADDVVQECISFAEDNNYEVSWVLDRFRTEFNRKVSKLIN